MTSAILARVWDESNATGPARLLLAVMADHADRRGIVRLTGTEMCRLARLSKDDLADALGDLVLTLGEVEPAEPGSAVLRINLGGIGSARSEAAKHVPQDSEPNIAAPAVEVTKPQPEPEPKTDAGQHYDVPPGLPPTIVGHYLNAAQVPIDNREPFYWFRREHRADADALTARGGFDVEHVASCLRANPVPPDMIVKRLTQLTALVSHPAQEGRNNS
jgi:hypothetical protein